MICGICNHYGEWFATGFWHDHPKAEVPGALFMSEVESPERTLFAIVLCSHLCARRFWNGCGGLIIRDHDRLNLSLEWSRQSTRHTKVKTPGQPDVAEVQR